MNWETVRASFLDELEKIAEVSLAGLSPATALSAQAPPMETAGFQKARDVLGRAETVKTAGLPQQPGFDRAFAKHESDPSAVQAAKGLGGYALGGAGAGRLVSEMTHSPMRVPDALKLHRSRWVGTAVGAGIGAAEFARRRIAKSQQQKTAMISPAMQLRASKQVAKVGNSARSVGSIADHVRGSQIH